MVDWKLSVFLINLSLFLNQQSFKKNSFINFWKVDVRTWYASYTPKYLLRSVYLILRTCLIHTCKLSSKLGWFWQSKKSIRRFGISVAFSVRCFLEAWNIFRRSIDSASKLPVTRIYLCVRFFIVFNFLHFLHVNKHTAYH